MKSVIRFGVQFFVTRDGDVFRVLRSGSVESLGKTYEYMKGRFTK